MGETKNRRSRPRPRNAGGGCVRAAAIGGILALASGAGAKAAPPSYAHVVVVVFENRAFEQISGAAEAPTFNRLAKGGALFTNARAVAHPSEPNYLALFSGSTQGVKDDADHRFDRPNLARSLAAAGKTFAGFIEQGSPSKHDPWRSFAGAEGFERPMTAFPADFSALPAVSFVIPNLRNDMHDGPIAGGDAWLDAKLGPYAAWALAHDSLLIVTFDEDDGRHDNHVFTAFYGAKIRSGAYAQPINHYDVLATLEAIERLPTLKGAGKPTPIDAIWRQP